MKKTLIALLVLCCLLLTACGQSAAPAAAPAVAPAEAAPAAEAAVEPAAAAGEFVYVMGHGAAENSIGDLYCKEFKRLVEEKTNGVVVVEVYSGSQLGTYGEMMQSLMDGDIGGMIFQPSPAVSFVPELSVLDIPYAFLGKSQEQIDKVLNDSEFATMLRDAFDAKGYKVMSFAQAATFRETTSNKEIRSAADFSGLNIRTLENNNHIAFWKSIGANPTPVAFGELYLALQQGLVEAQENPYDTALNAGFPEVQKYLINTHHILYPNLFVVNKALYESMPADIQAQFDAAAAEAKDFAEKLMGESSEKDKQAMIDAGMELIELPAEELQKLQDIGMPVVEAQVKEALGAEVVDAFMAALG